MTATRWPRKPGASTDGHRAPKARTADVLANMAPSELATVLRALLTKHPDLRLKADP